MGVFDDREKAFETRYFRDQDLEFLILVRRDKLFGLWAAEQAGLTGDAAQTFARSVIDSEIATHSILHKVCEDLNALGHPISEADLNVKLLEIHEIAREQVYKEQG